jgi:UDP-3-O-[3-hydroxymyristoyl] N-acetylglucosamine deacetylase
MQSASQAPAGAVLREPASMMPQRTLRHAIVATGTGLHTGAPVRLTLRPGAVDTGIVFRRSDLGRPADIPARATYLEATRPCLILRRGEARVVGVEHLLSALSGLGIDNAVVELSAPEVPAMDGSAAPFVFLLESAGIASQDAPKRFIRIKRPVQVSEGERWARLAPYDGLRVAFSLEQPAPHGAGLCRASFELSSAAFRSLSRARTFGFLREAGEHGGESAAAGAGADPLPAPVLRSRDELLDCKVLETLGGLYLLGHSLIGAFTGHCPGHALTVRLLAALEADSRSWDLEVFDARSPAPITFQAPG